MYVYLPPHVPSPGLDLHVASKRRQICQPKWEIKDIFHEYLDVNPFQEINAMTPDKALAKTISWQL
jgi:hypothetical protein